MKLTIIDSMLKTVSDLIDNIGATSTEKRKIKAEISHTIMQHLDYITEAQKDIIITEAKGNYLQRTWRPIVMLTFALIVVIGTFTPLDILKETSPFWDLLELGLGGYVIGRSAEKISGTIGKHLKR